MSTVLIAFIADYAVAHPDRKFYVVGGGIRTLDFTSLPARYDRLCLAVMLLFGRKEFGSQQVIAIRTHNPSDQPFAPSYALTFVPEPTTRDSDSVTFPFVYNLNDVRFDGPGEHRFTVSVNTEVVASLPVSIGVSELGLPGIGLPWSHELQQGFEAFAAGNAGLAESIFRELISKYPGVADAHNNLGYVLLNAGRPDEARTELLEGERLGYSRRDVLESNLGCCSYLLREFDVALEHYRRCILQPGVGGQSQLFGLGAAHPFNFIVASVGDYVAVASLNAGWCCARSGRFADAAGYQRAAGAMATAQTGFAAAEARYVEFTTSVRDLGELLVANGQPILGP